MTRSTINDSLAENQELIDQYDKESYEILIERWNQEHKPKTKTKKVEEEKEDINEFSF
jgi:nitrate/nitrite-specific signal transduction histidine kinase